ncbi:hypothetical protein MTR_7g022435 [Medicago truncatula]|uniref:Uncharacterized protein n=1 Tax=Medicago truncatula TaxID=3880 RepID=A0A072TXK0_MEDTR|nr:hypothetical protein MTR_7g022435 [Medicago truncatula]
MGGKKTPRGLDGHKHKEPKGDERHTSSMTVVSVEVNGAGKYEKSMTTCPS